MLDSTPPQKALLALRRARAEFLMAEKAFDETKKRLSSYFGSIEEGSDNGLLQQFVLDRISLAEQTLVPPGCAAKVGHEDLESALVQATGWQTQITGVPGETGPLVLRISTALLDGSLSVNDLWAALESVLSDPDVINRDYEFASTLLIRRFRASLTSKIRRVGGKITISHGVRTRVDHFGKRTFYYDGFPHFEQTIDLFARVADWAGMTAEAADIRQVGTGPLCHGVQIESREKIKLGGGIVLVTFNSRFEYRLPEPLGVALGQFIRQHAPHDFERYC